MVQSEQHVIYRLMAGEDREAQADMGLSTVCDCGITWERSGSVLDSRLRGCRFEPHRRHCVVFLSKTH